MHSPPPSTTAYDESLFTPGSIIAARYRIVACLGKGGMGEVYRADDLTLGQAVALKFLLAAIAESPRWMERFRNEVRTARQVAHPNVCRVHDLGEVPGPTGGTKLQFLTMEYIDGEDLASLLRRIGRLPRDKAVQLAHQMCAGLAAAHNAGVLHRDLKPANIMIDGRGNAKITDFGIAGLAGQIEGGDVRSGTPAYMAPEQLAAREVTLRSDIYSLGLVLYELFTGRRAFKADTATSATASRTSAELSRPSTLVDDMDPVVERVIMRCLNEDPAQRPSSAMIVAAGLPGGDPLRAALEAGETPSPELVAAAGSDRRVHLRLALPLAAVGVLSIVGSFVAARWTSLAAYLPLPRSPEVLADRARDVIEKMGPGLVRKDSASSLSLQLDRLAALAPDQSTVPDWKRLRTGRPAVLRYWLRTSPRELAAFGMTRAVGENDPPMDAPGMMLVELDSQGWLTSFRAVPPWNGTPSAAAPAAAGAPPVALAEKAAEKSETEEQPHSFDWGSAFQLAGLDIRKFTPGEPKGVPPDYADARLAWDSAEPEAPDAPVHVEAASFAGKPTFFRVE
jgi:serine/threonine-protein kinase